MEVHVFSMDVCAWGVLLYGCIINASNFFMIHTCFYQIHNITIIITSSNSSNDDQFIGDCCGLLI